jgi:predicted DNA-binding protein with PD1-like motif
MHSSILFFGLLMTVLLCGCQATRTVVTRSTTPTDDAKPNSDSVPEVYAVEGKFDRIVVLRFKYQADLLGGIEKMVKEKNIKNAVILAGIGSVRSVHYHAVSNRTFPSENVFINNPNASADIAGMNGYVMEGKVHAHITFANEHGAFGGHLEAGTQVFTFAIVTLGVMNDGVDFSRMDDKTYR